MAEIIKTWPGFMDREKVIDIFTHAWGCFYFTIGRGRPKVPIDALWFTHQGDILGFFLVREIVRNEGQLPKLRSISDQESEWQIKPDRWVAICPGPFTALTETVHFSGFRGWRYFDLEAYRVSLDSKVAL